ncbi:metal-dependent hydrolase [Hathewaya histolytica]|uniref:Putative metal-dependent hydrolase, membrane-bound n=1 Tax=Hathewaya histolytica TaxID=1498 RepID=A0A4U9R078_HATHI|nr:metal-dependent hydrolase [Hathewaya histolytica]VTQ83838.1 putative metal-dependent hydrolase, membrane-bound [Hathewaya histolytica]
MQGKTHATIGAASYVFFCSKFPGKFEVIGLIITVISALLPDIDHPKSILNKYILPIKNESTKRTFYACIGIIILWIDYIYLKDLAIKAVGFSFIAIALNSHRNGFSHSFLGFLIFSLVASMLEGKLSRPYLTFYIVIGYGGHLLCDMFTKAGIPLFYPVSRTKVKFPISYAVNSKVGRIIESIISSIALLYIVYALMPWEVLPIKFR